MLRAIIIDDELSAVISLDLLIKKFIPEIKVVSKTTKALEGFHLINDYRPDIVFLDIQMPHLNGFDLLEILEFRNFHLIFTTAYHKYALLALKKNATDFLLKPVNYQELQATVQKLIKQADIGRSFVDVNKLIASLAAYWQDKIPVHTKMSIEYLTPESIVYAEANNRNTILCVNNGMILKSTAPLKYYDEILCGSDLPFMRIHHSFIVNLNYITRYNKNNGGSVTIDNEKQITLSKKSKADFLKYLKLDGD